MTIKDRLEEWQKQVNRCSSAVQRAIIATETIMHSQTAFEYCKRGEDMPEMYGGGDSCGHTVMDINWSEDNLELLESDNILHAPPGIHEAYTELSKLAFDKKFDEAVMGPAYSKIVDGFWLKEAPKQIAEACVPKGDNPYQIKRVTPEVTYTKAAQKATVETTLIPERSREGIRTFSTTVYNELGEPVLDSVWQELDDVIILVERYAKPGEAMKGYGTKAFVEGPMAQSLKTGKPMVADELSHDARAFYEALEQKGVARFRMTPGEEYAYRIKPLVTPEVAKGSNPYPKPRPLAPLTKKELENKIADMKLRIDLEKDPNRRLLYRSFLQSYELRLKEVGKGNPGAVPRLPGLEAIRATRTIGEAEAMFRSVSAISDTYEQRLHRYIANLRDDPVLAKIYDDNTRITAKPASAETWQALTENEIKTIKRIEGLLPQFETKTV